MSDNSTRKSSNTKNMMKNAENTENIHTKTFFFKWDVNKCCDSHKNQDKAEFTIIEALEFIKKNPYLYESYGGYCVIPFFDFDIKNLTKQYLELNKIIFFERIRNVMNQVFNDADILYADSCGLYDKEKQLYKFSFHVIVRNHVYFRENKEILMYANLINKLLSDLSDENDQIPDKTEKNKNVKQKLEIDQSVYKTGNICNLRTIYSCKKAEFLNTGIKRIAVPVEYINGELKEMEKSPETFKKFLVGDVSGSELADEDEIKRIGEFYRAIGGDTTYIKPKKEIKSENNINDEFTLQIESTDKMIIDNGQEEDEIIKLLKKKMRSIHPDCEARESTELYEGIKDIRFDDIDNDCLICGRTHPNKGNQPFITYSRIHRVAYYKCQSQINDVKNESQKTIRIKLFGKPSKKQTIQELKSNLKNFFDTKDEYTYIDLFNEFRHAHFSSLEDLHFKLMPQAVKCIAVIIYGSGYIIKKDGLAGEDFKQISSLDNCDFDMTYDTITTDNRTKDKKEKKKTEKISFSQWIKQYMPCYQRIICDPSYKPDVKNFNIWTSYKATYNKALLENQEIKQNVDKLLLILRDIWAAENEQYYKYLLSWFAHIVKFPAKKTNISLFIHSKQGSGKSFFIDFFRDFIVGSDHGLVTNFDSLLKNFNKQLEQKTFICVEEMQNNASSFVNSFNFMKQLITANKIIIEPKFKDAYVAEDFANYCFTSNFLSFYLEPSDRRNACFRASDKYAQNKIFWEDVRKTCLNQDVGDAFYTYLMDIPNDEMVNLRDIPNTELRLKLIDQSKNSILTFVDNIISVLKNADLSDFNNGELNFNETNAEILEENDRVTREIKRLAVSANNKITIKAKDLYNIFVVWCADNNVNNKYEYKNFINKIDEIVPKQAGRNVIFDFTPLISP